MSGHIGATQGLEDRVSLESLPDELLQRIICTAALFDEEYRKRPGVGLVNRLFWRLYTSGRFAEGREMVVELDGPGREGPDAPSYCAALAACAPGVSALVLACPCSEVEDYPFQQVLGPLAPHVRRLQLYSMAGMPGLLLFLSAWPALEDIEVYEKEEDGATPDCLEGWPRSLAAKVRRLETDVPGVATVLPMLTALTRLSLEAGVDLAPAQLARLLPPLRQLRSIDIGDVGCAPTDCDTIAATLSSQQRLESCGLSMLGDALSPAITQLSGQLTRLCLGCDPHNPPDDVAGLAASWRCVWRLPALNNLILTSCSKWVWPEEAAAAAAVQAGAAPLSRAPACLPALRILHVHSCELPGNSLPRALFHAGALPALGMLVLDCGISARQAEEEGLRPAVQLPPVFSTLISLRLVALYGCFLQEPPPALLALPGLTGLLLKDNPLRALPPGPDPATPWAWLRRLRMLGLDHTPLAESLKAGGTPEGMPPYVREMVVERCSLPLF